MSYFKSTMLLLAILTFVINPELPAQGPQSRARQAFDQAKAVAERIHREEAAELIGQDLRELSLAVGSAISLHAEIDSLRGLLADELRSRANELRAHVLWHSWASVSQLAASSKGRAEVFLGEVYRGRDGRTPLLDQLITLLAQLSEGNPEPLRGRLLNSPHMVYDLPVELRYQASTTSSNISESSQWLWVPGMAGLVGNPEDEPVMNRGLVSFWGLVNHFVDASWKLEKDINGRILACLGHDGQDIAAIERIARLAGGRCLWSPDDAASAAEEPTKARLTRLAKFLSFRSAATGEDLVRVVNDLNQSRHSGGEPSFPLTKTLVDAAKSLDESRPSDALGEAVVWLRYALLMSFYDGGNILGEGVGLEREWARLRATNYKYADAMSSFGERGPIEAAGHREDLPTSVRWGCKPAPNSYAYLLDRTVDQMIVLLQTRADLRKIVNPNHLQVRPSSLMDSGKLTAGLSLLRTTAELGAVSIFTDAEAPSSFPLRSTATRAEQARAVAHLQGVGSILRSFAAEVELLNSTRLDPKNEPLKPTQQLGNKTSPWAVYVLPQKTLSAYRDDLQSALEQLKRAKWEAKDALSREVALAEYKMAVEEYRAAQYECEVVRIGGEVAELAQKMGERLRQIASLRVRSKEFEARCAALQRDANGSQLASRQLRLELQVQARDLCAAQVAALSQALEVAAQISEKARGELLKYAEELRSLASNIRDQKRRDAVLSIVRAVISVAGAALAPFTGGASAIIAQGINTAINTAVKIQEGGFDGVGKTLGTILEAADGFAAAGSLVARGVDNQTLQKAIGNAQDWLRNRRGDLTALQSTIAAVENKAMDGRKLLAMAAAGVSLKIDDSGKVTAGLRGSGLCLHKGTELASAAKEILALGGVLDYAGRGKVSPGGMIEGGQGLIALLEQVLVQAPTETLKQIEVPGGESSRAAFIAARNKLLDVIGREGVGVQARIAQSLKAGSVLIQYGDNIVFADRDVEGELEEFRKYIAAVSKSIAEEAIGDVVAKIAASRARLQEQARSAQERKDDASLETLANQVPDEIRNLEGHLQELQVEIGLKRGELARKEIELKASGYDRAAAESLLQASIESCEARSIDLEIAKMLHEDSLDVLRKEALGRKILEMQAKGRDFYLASRRTRVAQAAARCSALGLLDGGVGQDPALVTLSPVRVLDPWSLWEGAGALRQAIEAARGIVRWASLSPNEDVEGYADDLDNLSNLWLSSQSLGENQRALNAILDLAGRAQRIAEEARDTGALSAEIAVSRTVRGDELRFEVETEGGEKSPDGDWIILARVVVEVSEEHRSGSILNVDGAQVPVLESQDPTGQPAMAVIAPVDSLRIIQAGGDKRLENLQMWYRVLPPVAHQSSWAVTPQWQKSMRTAYQRVVPFNEDTLRNSVLERLLGSPESVQLWPAYGAWIFEIKIPVKHLLATLGYKEEDLEKAIAYVSEGLAVRVLLPVLVIQGGRARNR
jgi:hypothetical protein